MDFGVVVGAVLRMSTDPADAVSSVKGSLSSSDLESGAIRSLDQILIRSYARIISR